MVVQPGLCQTWSEIPKTGFLTTRLILLSFQLIFTDYVEQCLNIWSRRVYWQVPEQMEGYRPLPELIDTNGMAGGQRLCVAKQIARLFQTLHAQNMVQNDLSVDDVFVQVVDGVMNYVSS